VSSALPIIDTHQHVFWQGRDDAGLIADMDEHGVSLAWLLTWEIPAYPRHPEAISAARLLNPAHIRADGSHPGILLEDLLLARSRYPERFLVGYCPDPALPDAPELFEAAHAIHGVRICGEWKFRMLIDDPRCIELFRVAGSLKAPVVLHLDVPYLPPSNGRYVPSWYGGTAENLCRAIEACPETRFIGHAPGFWREISADSDSSAESYPRGPVKPGGRLERLLETYPNLSADLSAGSALIALTRDRSFARDFLIRYSRRLLFARDYYGGELLGFLRSLDLPEDVLNRLFYENARCLVPDSHPRTLSPIRPLVDS
jgi:predicted TIM-barrel fold metal-dependent hydrolase